MESMCEIFNLSTDMYDGNNIPVAGDTIPIGSSGGGSPITIRSPSGGSSCWGRSTITTVTGKVRMLSISCSVIVKVVLLSSTKYVLCVN